MSQITNFARFYELLRRLPYVGDKEELKESLVSQATNGRTSSLREVNFKEYGDLCRMMEKLCPDGGGREEYEARRRKSRSVCLRLMQKIGIDTTDWNAVNAYCRSPKIGGKEFRELSIDELDGMSLRLRMIYRKMKGEGKPPCPPVGVRGDR